MSALSRFVAPTALALGLVLGLPALADAPLTTDVAADSLSKKKQTKAGLYLTAAEAIDVLATREDVLLIDVRSPEETVFVGHASATDANIPFKLMGDGYAYNAKKNTYQMVDNANFVAATQSFLADKDAAAVLVICRSGGRSARAVDALVDGGVDVPLYSVIDGIEGDKDDAGKRTVNGWKLAGGDWGYKVQDGFLQGVD